MSARSRYLLHRVADLARSYPLAVVTIAVVGYLLYLVTRSSGVIAALLFAAGITVIWTADLRPSKLSALFAKDWPFFAVTSGVISLAVVPSLTDSTGSAGFYEAAAQVIPVLLLAMALEVRLVPERTSGVSLRMGMIVVYLLVGGEFSAFQSLNRGRGGETQFAFTVAGLVCGIVAVSLLAVSAHGGVEDDDS